MDFLRDVEEENLEDFFFEYIFDKDKGKMMENIDELIEVRQRIKSQISGFSLYDQKGRKSNFIRYIYMKSIKKELTDEDFNSMCRDYGSYKAEISKIIGIVAEDSVFKIVSPEGFPYLESGKELEDIQKEDLLCGSYIILPIVRNCLDIVCIHHKKKVIEYYSQNPSLFEETCETVSKALKAIVDDVYDWQFMEVPDIVVSSSHSLCVIHCLAHNIELSLLSQTYYTSFFKKIKTKYSSTES